MKSFNPITFRDQFPALKQTGTYLDSAATALKPHVMLDATYHYYHDNGTNVNRGQYDAALSTTTKFNLARQQVANFLALDNSQQIIWTKGTTESINLIAQSYAREILKPGDEIIVSELEHHSNFIPWLIVAKQTNARVVSLPINQQRLPDLDSLKQCLNSRSKILAITQMSNVTGSQPDLAGIIELARRHNVVVVVDGAQGVVHQQLNPHDLDIDFYTFSAHKLYGPTGLGVLYAKSSLLERMPVWHGGGKMAQSVSYNEFTALPYPQRFEAGTPNIAAVLAFAATLDWLCQINLLQAEHYTANLAHSAYHRLAKIPGFISYSAETSPLQSFNFANHHHSDIATLLAEQGIAIRHGEHCAQPLMNRLSVDGTLRVSFAPYNNANDVDALINGVKQAIMMLE